MDGRIYDEVNTMKDFIKSKGVTGQDIFMDHAGFSTYESLYRVCEEDLILKKNKNKLDKI